MPISSAILNGPSSLNVSIGLPALISGNRISFFLGITFAALCFFSKASSVCN